MTFAASAKSFPESRRGFTLVELLVVIGIIVVLAAIAVPMALRAHRSGQRARTAADLAAIGVALEAFKADFGDYPRPSGNNTGFACLGRFLVGPFGTGTTTFTPPTPPYKPGDCMYTGTPPDIEEFVCIRETSSSPPSGDWSGMGFFDGKEGPGFKKKIAGQYSGRTYGPYIQPDKFKMRGLALLDRQDNPILYFPASSARPNIHVNEGYAVAITSPTQKPLYNLSDNEIFFRVAGEAGNAKSVPTLHQLLGDMDGDGAIETGETAVTTGSFILWSAGADGIYGPVRNSGDNATPEMLKKYDDVTNFR